MSELNEMSCREFSDVAAELALGVLTGRERAQALAHLDHCDACRETVRELTMTGEALVGLLPSAEPPAGFETRVMERIGVAAPAPSPVSRIAHFGRKPASQPAPGQKGQAGRTRRMLAVAAVALAVVAAGLGWGLRGATSAPASSPLASATLLSASHHAAGKIFLYQGSPRWLYMSVDMPSGNGTVTCQVENRDGQVSTVGSFQLTAGNGYWGSPVPESYGQLTGARLVTANGTVLATATFHTA